MSDTNQELKQKLREWAQAYGGEQFGRLGYASTEQLKHAAAEMPPAIPDGTPAAHAIENIVQRMEAQGRWKEARVLRADYFMEGLTEAERMQRLGRLGLRIGRSAYYAYLNSALAVVEFTLSGESSK